MQLAVNVQGGLGNVLFQVAFGIAAARRYDCGLYIGKEDLHHMTNVGYRYFLRGIQRKSEETLVAEGFVDVKPGDISADKAVAVAISEMREALDAAKAAGPEGRVRIFNGFFQSPQWWGVDGIGADGVAEDIRARYAVPVDVRATLEDRYGGAARLARAFFIHVRRGDYVGSPFDLGLERAYFARAWAAATATTAPLRLPEDAVCFFFTDDPRYTPAMFRERTGVDFGGRAVEVIGGHRDSGGLDECVTLFLMSLCRLGGICSNSTFSWWAGYLNDAPDKRVYFPSEWCFDKLAFPGLIPVPVAVAVANLSE